MCSNHFGREVERDCVGAVMKVQAVPTVFADGEQIHVGRGNIGDLLEKLEVRYGASASKIYKGFWTSSRNAIRY